MTDAAVAVLAVPVLGWSIVSGAPARDGDSARMNVGEFRRNLTPRMLGAGLARREHHRPAGPAPRCRHRSLAARVDQR